MLLPLHQPTEGFHAKTLRRYLDGEVYHCEIAQHKDFAVSYYRCSASQSFLLRGSFELPTLVLCLSNPLLLAIDKLGVISVPRHHFRIFTPLKSYTLQVDTGSTYSFLTLSFASSFVQASGVTDIDEYLEGAKAKSPLSMSRNAVTADQEILEGSKQLTTCKLEGALRATFLSAKVTELLMISIAKLVGKRTRKFDIALTNDHERQIREAMNYMLAHLDSRLNPKELAKKGGITNWRLEKGFKFVAGNAIEKWFAEARLQKAKELLLTTRQPIEEIGKKIGYMNQINFINRFKKRFSEPPGQFRTKHATMQKA